MIVIVIIYTYINNYILYFLVCSLMRVIIYTYINIWGFPGGASDKEPSANVGDIRDVGLILGLEIPWRRSQQPTPVFLPGEFHGQRSLEGYSPKGLKESDMTEAT